MHLVLIARSDGTVLDSPENARYKHQAVLERLAAIGTQGHSWEHVDSLDLPSEQLESRYFEAASRSARAHVPISQIFGSGSRSGATGFGMTVPALLVYGEEDQIVSVYPSNNDGQLFTIADYLDQIQ